MLKNDQIYFKNFVVVARLLKYVWPFFNIRHEKVNRTNTQPVFAFSKLTIETLEQGVKYV